MSRLNAVFLRLSKCWAKMALILTKIPAKDNPCKAPNMILRKRIPRAKKQMLIPNPVKRQQTRSTVLQESHRQRRPIKAPAKLSRESGSVTGQDASSRVVPNVSMMP
uniref:Putative secreted protein n=1 Tax=Ixodes ricinus TaxID=34613 RepID=A0A6B0UGM2_IXORI